MSTPSDRADFVTWTNNAERAKVLRTVANDTLDSYGVVRRDGLYTSQADFRGYRNFKDIDTATSVRPGFNRGDYEFFRPDEALPKDQKEAILRCMKAYERNGLIKNVIDLMGDFATQGIRLVHPNPKVEKFYRNWFNKVNGAERSERFLNYLYRCGNVIAKRTTATVSISGVTKADRDAIKTKVELKPNEIPWRYTFLNPLAIETVGEELAQFVGKPIYALNLPLLLRAKIKNPKNDDEKKLVEQIPADIRAAAMRGDQYVVIDQNALSVYHYKKDDWLVWGYPLCYAILTDIMMYDKLKLTDIAACDNAISSVRLWRLGNIDAKIFPTKAGIKKLSDVLTNNVGGGQIDLVWGPELEFQESNSQIYKFLGQEKYGPTLTAIYGGLGIPATLTGAAGSQGMTNNYISLKTLTERLEYGRSILVQFWREEIALVQKTMGFKLPAEVIFDRMTLSDETAEKQLLISLIDRDVISAETVLERFDEIPEVEKRRLIREQKARQEGKLPEKAGPFHKTQITEQLKSGFVQQGIVTPSQVGVDLQPKKKGEKNLREHLLEEQQAKQAASQSNPKGQPGQGRPANSKDSQKRKTKQVKPRTKAALQEMWAKAALERIADITTPGILDHFGKSNLRKLTQDEADQFENIKFGILCQFDPFETVDEQSVANVLDLGAGIPHEMNEVYYELQSAYATEFSRQPTTEDLRQLQIMVYNSYKDSSDVEN